jgi:hypothetical protein
MGSMLLLQPPTPPLPQGQSNRSFKKTDLFIAETSRGEMCFQRAGNKLYADVLQKIWNDPSHAIDRAYAERWVTKENQEKENKDPKAKKLVLVTLPNGGKSKASRSKQNRTLGAVFNQTTKASARNKATPNRYRAEGIQNS